MNHPPTSAAGKPPPPRRDRISRWIAVTFVFALIMGPGPGAYLIKSAPGGIPATFLGLPALYAWAAFWFFVMAACILATSWKVWPDERIAGETEKRK